MAYSVDLWDDCEVSPFVFRVHAFQHNERVFAKYLGASRELLVTVSDCQRRLRFEHGADTSKPAAFLWSHTEGGAAALRLAPRPAWLVSLQMSGDSVFAGKFTTEEGLRAVSLV